MVALAGKPHNNEDHKPQEGATVVFRDAAEASKRGVVHPALCCVVASQVQQGEYIDGRGWFYYVDLVGPGGMGRMAKVDITHLAAPKEAKWTPVHLAAALGCEAGVMKALVGGAGGGEVRGRWNMGGDVTGTNLTRAHTLT